MSACLKKLARTFRTHSRRRRIINLINIYILSRAKRKIAHTFNFFSFALLIFIFIFSEQPVRIERFYGIVGHVVQRQSATVHRLLSLRFHSGRLWVSSVLNFVFYYIHPFKRSKLNSFQTVSRCRRLISMLERTNRSSCNGILHGDNNVSVIKDNGTIMILLLCITCTYIVLYYSIVTSY